ncbi:MAG: hypothetical protein R2729_11135 [Bryobacteraceae bacterium]
MENRTVLRIFAAIAPLFTWLLSLLIPRRNADVAKTECENKCEIMTLVQGFDSYIDPEGRKPLGPILERCYAMGHFPALWAVEGVGKDLAEQRLAKGGEIHGILSEAVLGPEWDKSQLMMHAGIGIGFAKYYIERMGNSPSQGEIEAAVERIVKLCRDNSRPGYYGAAIESLGLASRFMRGPEFCKQAHRALEAKAPDSIDYFWRGAGRCLYFHPSNFMPGFSRPCRAIDMSKVEAPSPEVRTGMLAGTAWALTVVNMRTPQVMEWALAHYDDYDGGNPGFVNGVISSVVMRYDTTPDDPGIQAFRNHKPADPNVRAVWERTIRDSVDFAVGAAHPVLKKHARLDEVFRYQDLRALVAELERNGA